MLQKAQAAALIAHGAHIIQSINVARDMNRWIGSSDLANYLRDSLALLFPGCALRPIDDDRTFDLYLTSEARLAFSPLLSAHTRRAPWPAVGGSMRRFSPVAVSISAMCEPASEA